MQWVIGGIRCLLSWSRFSFLSFSSFVGPEEIPVPAESTSLITTWRDGSIGTIWKVRVCVFFNVNQFCDLHFSNFGPNGTWAQGPWAQRLMGPRKHGRRGPGAHRPSWDSWNAENFRNPFTPSQSAPRDFFPSTHTPPFHPPAHGPWAHGPRALVPWARGLRISARHLGNMEKTDF